MRHFYFRFILISIILSFNSIYALDFLYQCNFYEKETIYHSILPGNFHKGGDVTISSQEQVNTEDVEVLRVSFKYKITPRSYIPISKDSLSGDRKVDLPIYFASEQGYQKLQKEGAIIVRQNRISFLGRVDVAYYKNAYKMKVVDLDEDNKDLDGYIIVYYHPDVLGTGWIKSQIVINNIPIIGSYEINSVLKE